MKFNITFYQYYQFSNEEVHETSSNRNDHLEEILVGLIKAQSKFAGRKHITKNFYEFMKKKMKTFTPKFIFGDSLEYLEAERVNKQSVSYGDPKEFEKNTELDNNILKHRINSNQALRCLLTIKYEFTYDAPTNTNMKDSKELKELIEKITKNKKKQTLYLACMAEEFPRLLEYAEDYYQKYKDFLDESNGKEIVNAYNDHHAKFLSDSGDLFKKIMDWVLNYYKFLAKLSQNKQKKLGKLSEENTMSDNEANKVNVNLNLSGTTKHINYSWNDPFSGFRRTLF